MAAVAATLPSPMQWERGTVRRRADGGEGKPHLLNSKAADRPAVQGACPLHHSLSASLGERSPSPASQER